MIARDTARPSAEAEAGSSTAAGGFLSALRNGDVRSLVGRYSDLALAALVVAIVGMLIIPLPTVVLDLLISINIAVAITLLLISIYVSEALRIATFPTLLLLTTLFRLALEVSATRLILLRADAGEVIHAFGNFVVAGNLVVGAVIFLILTLIQFIVISKGSERVAEVAARFALDAMPGKQMAIDAELRAGHIDQEQARRRRLLLARESQLFGSMDGAMKFVKGDAVAGLVVLAVNIVGGLAIGILQRGMSAVDAARTYTVLTIGEGLVAQIPALIISTSAGIIVTRVASEDEGAHLGGDIATQVLSHPKAIAVAAGLLALLAIVPGLPALPFLTLAAVLGFVAHRLLRSPARGSAAAAGAGAESAAGAGTGGSVLSSVAGRRDLPPPMLTPLSIELGAALATTFVPAGDPAQLTADLVPALRDRLFAELGIPLPVLRVRLIPTLAPDTYVIRMNEVPLARGTIPARAAAFVAEPPERLAPLRISGDPAAHPDGSPGAFVSPQGRAAAEAAGLTVLELEQLLGDHLMIVLRRYGFELIGIQETHNLLESLERTHPALVREVVPKLISPALLTDVLRRLAEEGVSLRNLKDVLGTLAEHAPNERDPVVLTEHVRSSLRRALTFRHAGPGGTLPVYLLEPAIEDAVRQSVHKTPTGSYLALEPQLSREIILAVGRTVAKPASGAEAPAPVVLTAPDIRRYVRRLLETEHPNLAVLSYAELAPDAQIQPLGHIRVAGPA